jgi:uncharacterized membrane protein YcaP (DUF421 family)
MIMLRLMGKRQIGELEPSELVVTIIISQLASMPIQDPSKSLLNSFVGILTIVSLEIISSYIAYKNYKFRSLIYGTPSILVEKGKMNEYEMEGQRFNINDLMENLRAAGLYSLAEVDYVILETNGSVSIILNSANQPATPEDLNLNVPPIELSYIIIDSGIINYANLKHIGFDEKWLKKKLRENDVSSEKDVYYMGADRNGEIYLIKRQRKKQKKK